MPPASRRPKDSTVRRTTAACLGMMGRDRVTGFEGIIVGHARYVTSSTQVLLASPTVDKDGKPTGAFWFDISRVETLLNVPVPQISNDQ